MHGRRAGAWPGSRSGWYHPAVITRPQLPASRREVTGKAVARLRRAGILPAVVYGHGVPSESIQVDAREFETIRRRAGRNVILDLRLDGGRARPVLVHGVQEHPVARRPVHVDFFVVRMTEELTVDVGLVLTGEAPAVTELGGTLLTLRDAIQVRALPDKLPQSIELDLASLETFDVVLHVADLQLPPDVVLVTDPAEPLVRVVPPRVEEEPVTGVVEEAPEPVEAGAEEDSSAEGDAAE